MGLYTFASSQMKNLIKEYLAYYLAWFMIAFWSPIIWIEKQIKGEKCIHGVSGVTNEAIQVIKDHHYCKV